MSGQYLSEHHMTFDLQTSEADRRMAQEVAEDYDRRGRSASEARARRLSDIKSSVDKQIRELLGEDNWLSLRQRLRDERKSFVDLFQPPSERHSEYEDLNAVRRARLQAYFDSLQVDAGALRRIVTEGAAAVQEELTVAVADSGFAQWLHDAPGDMPALAGRDDPHAWTPFRPPFPGFQKGFEPHNLGGFRVTREHALDQNAGMVGHDLMLDNNDASDFDNGWAVVDTQIGFNYHAPATGLVEVFIEARCGHGRHHLRVVDEFGVSDSSTSQENQLMAHVLHPNVTGPSVAWMSKFKLDTDDTAVVDREFLVPGRNYTARLFSNGPIVKGQTVHIRAGTRSRDGSITNDMEINSRSSFRWFLGTVWVRIAP